MIGLARRDGNLRYYDLLERLVPAELLAHQVPEREQLRTSAYLRFAGVSRLEWAPHLEMEKRLFPEASSMRLQVSLERGR